MMFSVKSTTSPEYLNVKNINPLMDDFLKIDYKTVSIQFSVYEQVMR